MNYQIKKMESAEWEQVAAIYGEGIKTGIATFQQEIPNWEEWDRSHCKVCRFVAKEEDQILGWAALSPSSGRCVYSGVAEVSIYIHPAYQGEGIGRHLLQTVIEDSEKNGFWTLQAGIIRENIRSRALHESCGFRTVGFREKLGKMKDGNWYDVFLVERRSQIAGVD